MGDHDHGVGGRKLAKQRHDLRVGFRVEVGGGFVAQYHPSPGQQAAGDADSLGLTGADEGGILTDRGIESSLCDDILHVHCVKRCRDLLIACVWGGQQQVLAQRPGK